MNKSTSIKILIPFFILVLGFNPQAFSKDNIDNCEKLAVSISHNQAVNDLAQIKNFLKLHDSYSNSGDIEKLKTLYTTDYQNGDGLKYDDFFNMVNKTWQTYSDMKYTSEVNDIRINDSFATITTTDYASATTAKVSELTNDKGDLTSKSNNILYLKKLGTNWKIFSDKVVYERTFLRYGDTKNLLMDFKAPEQVTAGQDYTATLDIIVPKNNLAIGSIAKELIVYPDVEPKDVFRQIPSDVGTLERVMKSNVTGNNEFAVASVGLTAPKVDADRKIRLNLRGVVFVMQRVNVLAKSTYVPPEKPANEI